MIPLHRLTATFSLLISPLWALPHPFETVTVTADDPTETPIGYGYPPTSSTPTLTPFTNQTTSETARLLTTTAPPLSSTSSSRSRSSFTGHCDYSFCNSGSKVCFYWAGITSWDVSRGPVPGEVPTIIGTC
ncbi:uncharacterized protein F4812DRAFT_465212 [Daldinia caldariorum]|uniref:uncharacterized protein n=1 Tax=Daldinia caldariorum TaxID=326644 RepID=UPI002007AC87|nr:uncharacterized protein F4812DRAFT_465212 [Daldinia caldariorum]KAI1467102.1 hypothetical protein F4812DRAFT_465212 [Daldinia caldariorum]